MGEKTEKKEKGLTTSQLREGGKSKRERIKTREEKRWEKKGNTGAERTVRNTHTGGGTCGKTL